MEKCIGYFKRESMYKFVDAIKVHVYYNNNVEAFYKVVSMADSPGYCKCLVDLGYKDCGWK